METTRKHIKMPVTLKERLEKEKVRSGIDENAICLTAIEKHLDSIDMKLARILKGAE